MSLADQTMGLVKYPPERLVESRFILAVPANQAVDHTVISQCEPYLIWARNIGIDRNASLQARLEGVIADRNYENQFPFIAATTVLDYHIPLDVPFDHDMRFVITNVTAAAVNNYQARLVYEVMNYTVADKVAQGLKIGPDRFTDYELELIEKYLIVNRVFTGELPMKYPKGALMEAHAGQYSAVVAAGEETTILERSVPADSKICLSKVWCSQPAANFGDLEIRIYRDRNLFLTVFPYMIPNFTTIVRNIPALELWIPALTNLRVTIESDTGGHGAILAMVEAEERKLTIWDKLNWGLRLTKEEIAFAADMNLREKLDAGLYSLYTPMRGGALGRP